MSFIYSSFKGKKTNRENQRKKVKTNETKKGLKIEKSKKEKKVMNKNIWDECMIIFILISNGEFVFLFRDSVWYRIGVSVGCSLTTWI